MQNNIKINVFEKRKEKQDFKEPTHDSPVLSAAVDQHRLVLLSSFLTEIAHLLLCLCSLPTASTTNTAFLNCRRAQAGAGAEAKLGVSSGAKVCNRLPTCDLKALNLQDKMSQLDLELQL